MTSNSNFDQAVAFHYQAEQARENQLYEESLTLYAQALYYFGLAGAVSKVSEVHAARSIVFRHLLNQNVDEKTQQLWTKEVELEIKASVAMAELAARQGDETGLAMAYVNAAKFYELQGDVNQAVKLFERAVRWQTTAPATDHNRPSVLWDFKLKLALAGLAQHQDQQKALEKVLAAIHALETATGSDAEYNVKVWISGAYLRLAAYFKKIDTQQAQTYLEKAKMLVMSDDRLKIRRAEYQKIAIEFDEKET